MRTAMKIANYFLKMTAVKKAGVSPLKLQKLVYVAHAWHLALTDGIPLVEDEWVEAWKYGPVFPSIYHEFKKFGNRKITAFGTDIVRNGDDFEVVEPMLETSETPVFKLLDRIWEVYGKYSGIELSNMTHASGSPWDIARQDGGAKRNLHIENDDIADYYRKLMRGRHNEQQSAA